MYDEHLKKGTFELLGPRTPRHRVPTQSSENNNPSQRLSLFNLYGVPVPQQSMVENSQTKNIVSHSKSIAMHSLSLLKSGLYSDFTVIFNQKSYNLHRFILSQSDYFRAIFSNKDFSETITHTITIDFDEEDSVGDVFPLILEWLYSGSISKKNDDLQTAGGKLQLNPFTLFPLLAMADYLQISPLIEDLEVYCQSIHVDELIYFLKDVSEFRMDKFFKVDAISGKVVQVSNNQPFNEFQTFDTFGAPTINTSQNYSSTDFMFSDSAIRSEIKVSDGIHERFFRLALESIAKNFLSLSGSVNFGFLHPIILQELLNHKDIVTHSEYQVYKILSNYCTKDRAEYLDSIKQFCGCQEEKVAEEDISTSQTPPTAINFAHNNDCIYKDPLSTEQISGLFERLFFENMTEAELKEVSIDPIVPKEFVILGMMEIIRKLNGNPSLSTPVKQQSRRNSIKSREGGKFIHSKDFDENGVIYFLSLLSKNPLLSGEIKMSIYPNLKEGCLSNLIARKPITTYTARNNSSDILCNIQIEFTNWELACTHYTLRNGYSSASADTLRNWTFQGSKDSGKTWRILSRHFNDDSLGAWYGSNTWPVHCIESYSCFKIETMETTGYPMLVLSGIEFYGDLQPKAKTNLADKITIGARNMIEYRFPSEDSI